MSSSPVQHERRAAQRFPFQIPVTLRLSGEVECRGVTQDVSARGAKIRPRGSFQVGTTLDLEFIKPDNRRLRVSGVAWRAEADALVVLFLGTIPQGFTDLRTS